MCPGWTQEILERAKGFEPSTPTLARSCSTTELHPHPRDWRRSRAGNGQSYAKCAPRMQQSARGLRTGPMARYRSDCGQISPKRPTNGRQPHLTRLSGTRKAGCRPNLRSDSRHLPSQPRRVPARSSRRGRVAIKGRLPFDEGPVAVGSGQSARGFRPHLEPIEISRQTAT
jgi:hypothetical protein